MLDYSRYRPARETRTLREQLLADPELLDGLAGPAAPSLDAPSAATALDWPAWKARWSSLDPDLAAWAGVPQAMAAAREGRLDLTALKFDGTAIPRLDSAAELRPIAELDEHRPQSLLDLGELSDLSDFFPFRQAV
jgi:hypothetical protein